MTSPQLENGYGKIATEIMEVLCRTKLVEQESKIVWAVLRKTYGFQKKSDRISLSQFSSMTRLSTSHVAHTTKRLSERHIITITKNGFYSVYEFQKDYTKWVDLPLNHKVLPNEALPNHALPSGVLPNEAQGTAPLSNSVLPNGADTKDTITKDNRQKIYIIASDKTDALNNDDVINSQELTKNGKKLRKFPLELIEPRKLVIKVLNERRGYAGTMAAAEARAISLMLQDKYTPQQILDTYDIMKQQPFWQMKPLWMMSVRNNIGETVKNNFRILGNSYKDEPIVMKGQMPVEHLEFTQDGAE